MRKTTVVAAALALIVDCSCDRLLNSEARLDRRLREGSVVLLQDSHARAAGEGTLVRCLDADLTWKYEWTENIDGNLLVGGSWTITYGYLPANLNGQTMNLLHIVDGVAWDTYISRLTGGPDDHGRFGYRNYGEFHFFIDSIESANQVIMHMTIRLVFHRISEEEVPGEWVVTESTFTGSPNTSYMPILEGQVFRFGHGNYGNYSVWSEDHALSQGRWYLDDGRLLRLFGENPEYHYEYEISTAPYLNSMFLYGYRKIKNPDILLREDARLSRLP